MKRSRIHKILAIWLLGVFMFNITPREFIHLFTNHEDTHDTVIEGLAISSQHQHCSFLNIGVPPYEIVDFTYCPLVASVTWERLVAPLVRYTYAVPARISLRGPPSPRFA